MNNDLVTLCNNMKAQVSNETTFHLGIKSLFMLRQQLFDILLHLKSVLSREDFNAMPYIGVDGFHSKTIVYSIWHIFRIEDMFPNVKVIILMGDVAKKAFNLICKKATKKNAVPSVSTYKLCNTEIVYNGIRILPSYIMTGQNILIEKSKFEMASEDIAMMYRLIKES